jgi:hypothetical protein
MGLLYTTPGTQRILDTLNTAFDRSNDGLAYIRARATPGSKLEDMLKKKNWAAGHLASALKLFPYDQSPREEPLQDYDVRRWAYFLKKVVGNDLFKKIKEKLAEAILSPNFVSVSFNHIESNRQDLLVIDTPVGSDLNGPFARHLTVYTINVPAGKVDDFDRPPTTPDEPDPLPSPPWQKPRPKP